MAALTIRVPLSEETWKNLCEKDIELLRELTADAAQRAVETELERRSRDQ
jgi:hypothetical protein